MLLLFNGFPSNTFKVINSSSQTNGISYIGCACFKLIGDIIKSSPGKAYIFDHLSTTLIGRHLIKQFNAAIETTNTCWTVHLVSGEAIEITSQRLYIYPAMRQTLCAIYQDRHRVFMCHADHFSNGIYSAKSI